MNPSLSMIVFTISSGLGYGMLVILALLAVTGAIPTSSWLGFVGLGSALAAVTFGLLLSLSRLGRARRAWMVLTQIRSSWLSREGLSGLMTYVPALLFAFGWIFLRDTSGIFTIFALATVFGAITTVYCTGKKFASLRTVQAWHQRLTVPVYLAFALMTGALATHLLVALFGLPNGLIGFLTLIAVASAFGLKTLAWQEQSEDQPVATIENATGLGDFGPIRTFDPPRTQSHYLLREMGFEIGRKHAQRLRKYAVYSGLIGSLLMTLLAMFLHGWLSLITALLAFATGMVGVFLERWLFFAEAEHVSMLFYGQSAKDEVSLETDQAKLPTEKIRRKRRPRSALASGKPIA